MQQSATISNAKSHQAQLQVPLPSKRFVFNSH